MNNNNVIQESLHWLRFTRGDLDVALHLTSGTLTAPTCVLALSTSCRKGTKSSSGIRKYSFFIHS